MKAAVVREFGEPLVIEDRPIPEPGPGQITVRMEASGLCHTDIHAANGDWPVKPSSAVRARATRAWARCTPSATASTT